MASIAEKYGPRGVQVVGVHSPQFEEEKDRSAVQAALERLGVRYPIVLDNDESMWNALGTEAWPSLYVVDRKGTIRAMHTGRILAGDADATRIEALIENLIREST